MPNKPTITDLGMMITLKDLNNPLTSIRLCLDLLETSDPSEKAQEPYYGIIKKNTRAMTISLREMYEVLAEKYRGSEWEEHPASFPGAPPGAGCVHQENEGMCG